MIYEKLGDRRGLVQTYLNIAEFYLKMKEYDRCLSNLQKSLSISEKYGYKDYIRDYHKILYKVYFDKKEYTKAFETQNTYLTMKDSLSSKDIDELISKLRISYDLEKKEAELISVNKDKIIQREILNRQRLIILIFGLAFVFLALLAIVLYRMNGHKNRANIKLEKQKNEILEKNHEIQNKNEEILRQADELQKLNDLKDRLLSIISHDFRSPLNSLGGTLYLINSGDLSQEEIISISKKLEENVKRTTYLLDNMLYWAKSQMKGIEIAPGLIALKKLVNDNIKLFEPQVKKKNINFINEIPDDIFIFADENMIDLVLRNLISNAIKFTKKEGHVSILANRNGDMIEIKITDDGVGMDKETAKRIFSHENYTTIGTEKEKGTGLGLIICKEFIEKNGGEIWVESEMNIGSVFRFTLPANG